MKLFLVRHGSDTPGKRGGWSDEPLTLEGIEEVNQLGIELSKINFDYMLSSDLMRAKQTTEILTQHVKYLNPPRYLKELREVNNGVLAGMPNDLASFKYPGLYWNTLSYHETYPEGESPALYFNRVKSIYNEVISTYKNSENILIVTHQGVIEAFMHLHHQSEFTNRSLTYKVKPAEYRCIKIDT